MYFANITGLFLLSFLVALLILYLIKAKPKEVTMPSLLFFMSEKKVSKYNAWLKKLLLRILFILQALIIVALAFAAANPIINLPVDAYSLNSVVIIDVSASMGTVEKNVPRIDLGKQELLSNIKGTVSIILAEESPIVVANNISSSRAKAIITNLESKELPTRLDSAITLADELLGEERGNIIVYSDFILNKEDDVIAAKKLAEANDKRVKFINIGDKKINVGFINLNLQRGSAEAFIKNFGSSKQMVDVKLTNARKEDTTRLEIEPNSIERISFEIKSGETVLRIPKADSLLSDNTLYLLNPYESKTSILFITNSGKESPLIDAMRANPSFDVKVTVPPVIPDLTQDVVVVSDVDKNMLLPNTFRDINKYRTNGGKVIVAAQEDFDKLDFQDLLSFSIGNLVSGENEICVDVVNEYTSRISNPNCFTSTMRFYKTGTDNSSVVLASTVSGEGIFIMENGLFYYGIIDEMSGFKDQINYPLFWDDIINSLLGKENLANFNYRTGDIVVLGNSSKILDKTGIIDIGNKEVAVNLVNSHESDIYRDSATLSSEDYKTDYEKLNLEVNLDQVLIILATIMLFIELIYIKRRGDL